MNIRRRMEVLERRASSSDVMTIVNITGGFPVPYLKTAAAGPYKLQQDHDESLDTFRNRVIDFAKASDERCVMIGGLPDDPDGQNDL